MVIKFKYKIIKDLIILKSEPIIKLKIYHFKKDEILFLCS